MYLNSCMTAFALLITTASAQAQPVAADRRAPSVDAGALAEVAVDAPAAIEAMAARVKQSVGALRFSADGALESMSYLGQRITVRAAGATITGFEIDGKRYQVQAASRTAGTPDASVVIVDADSHRPVAIVESSKNALMQSIVPASAVEQLPVSSYSVDDARALIKSGEDDVEMTTLSRLIALGKAKKLCQDSTDCDGMKELDTARCDFAYDQATAYAAFITAGGAAVGGAIGSVPGLVVGVAGGGAVAATILYTAGATRYSCRAKALSDWAACKNSC